MEKDPYNVVVAGVGGQGNVLGTQLLGAVLVDQGYKVTIGETYGASQRGGSVMSHMRVSMTDQYGPLIPPRCADLVIALEPSEAVRVLAQYGNPNTVTVVNTRTIFPVDVTSGNLAYPEKDALMAKIIALSKKAFFLEATEKALELGNPILANIIMIGAVSGAGILSITEVELAKAIRENISSDKVDVNLKAFAIGKEMTNCD
ncbi:MAG: indolepyruvate oxidoreductase subunit beta [Deltaproteobacteria bacterium]|nr:indolepyruvate oxidoreductase subunit beta [Deltaproteobacteria bacterium]